MHWLQSLQNFPICHTRACISPSVQQLKCREHDRLISLITPLSIQNPTLSAKPLPNPGNLSQSLEVFFFHTWMQFAINLHPRLPQHLPLRFQIAEPTGCDAPRKEAREVTVAEVRLNVAGDRARSCLQRCKRENATYSSFTSGAAGAKGVEGALTSVPAVDHVGDGFCDDDCASGAVEKLDEYLGGGDSGSGPEATK